jgi:hypothetical protein
VHAIEDDGGAPGTARTCNPQIRSLVLYPLSYGRCACSPRATIYRLAAALKAIARANSQQAALPRTIAW